MIGIRNGFFNCLYQIYLRLLLPLQEQQTQEQLQAQQLQEQHLQEQLLKKQQMLRQQIQQQLYQQQMQQQQLQQQILRQQMLQQQMLQQINKPNDRPQDCTQTLNNQLPPGWRHANGQNNTPAYYNMLTNEYTEVRPTLPAEGYAIGYR